MATNADDKQFVPQLGTVSNLAPSGDFHDGNVVSFSGDTLVMEFGEGNEFSFTVASDAFVCCDGVTCRAEDLREGSRIRVVTQADNINVATKIESLDKQVDFADLS